VDGIHGLEDEVARHTATIVPLSAQREGSPVCSESLGSTLE
jgi:hypothetical protein